MGRHGVLRPVGPEPAQVYWRRRALLLALVVIVVVALARACTGGSAGPTAGGARSPAGTPVTTPTPATSPTPTPTAGTTSKPARCAPADLDVTAATDATTYPAGTLPVLSARVTNTSKAPCRLVVAQADRTWTVSSGADRVWSTADCARGRARSSLRLAPGGATGYSLRWDRHRSVEGCASPGAEAAAGTYVLTVRIAGAGHGTAVFHLTG